MPSDNMYRDPSDTRNLTETGAPPEPNPVSPTGLARESMADDLVRAQWTSQVPGAIEGFGGYVYKPEADGSITILHGPSQDSSERSVKPGADGYKAIVNELTEKGAWPAAQEAEAPLAEPSMVSQAEDPLYGNTGSDTRGILPPARTGDVANLSQEEVAAESLPYHPGVANESYPSDLPPEEPTSPDVYSPPESEPAVDRGEGNPLVNESGHGFLRAEGDIATGKAASGAYDAAQGLAQGAADSAASAFRGAQAHQDAGGPAAPPPEPAPEEKSPPRRSFDLSEEELAGESAPEYPAKEPSTPDEGKADAEMASALPDSDPRKLNILKQAFELVFGKDPNGGAA